MISGVQKTAALCFSADRKWLKISDPVRQLRLNDRPPEGGTADFSDLPTVLLHGHFGFRSFSSRDRA